MYLGMRRKTPLQLAFLALADNRHVIASRFGMYVCSAIGPSPSSE